MNQSTAIILLPELARRMRLSESGVRHRLTLRRKGKNDFPMPISGHKERLAWLECEVEEYIQRRNRQANHCVPAPQVAQALSPETLRDAAKLGLLDDDSTNTRRSKRGA